MFAVNLNKYSGCQKFFAAGICKELPRRRSYLIESTYLL